MSGIKNIAMYYRIDPDGWIDTSAASFKKADLRLTAKQKRDGWLVGETIVTNFTVQYGDFLDHDLRREGFK